MIKDQIQYRSQSLLNLACGYFRYIRNFARIAKPLTDLLQVPSHLKGRQQKCKSGQQALSEKVNWTDKQEDALSTLIDFLAREPIPALPRFDLPYVLRSYMRLKMDLVRYYISIRMV